MIVLDASCVYQSISKSKEGRSLKFGDVFTDEKKWIDEFKKRNTPVLVVLNKTDLIGDNTSLCMDWLCETLKPEYQRMQEVWSLLWQVLQGNWE